MFSLSEGIKNIVKSKKQVNDAIEPKTSDLDNNNKLDISDLYSEINHILKDNSYNELNSFGNQNETNNKLKNSNLSNKLLMENDKFFKELEINQFESSPITYNQNTNKLDDKQQDTYLKENQHICQANSSD